MVFTDDGLFTSSIHFVYLDVGGRDFPGGPGRRRFSDKMGDRRGRDDIGDRSSRHRSPDSQVPNFILYYLLCSFKFFFF